MRFFRPRQATNMEIINFWLCWTRTYCSSYNTVENKIKFGPSWIFLLLVLVCCSTPQLGLLFFAIMYENPFRKDYQLCRYLHKRNSCTFSIIRKFPANSFMCRTVLSPTPSKLLSVAFLNRAFIFRMPDIGVFPDRENRASPDLRK